MTAASAPDPNSGWPVARFQPRQARGNAAIASGVVFFLVHWLAYGAQPHPAYFLSGWVFAWAFMFAGLPGALMVHGGENFGVLVLGTFAL